MTEVQRTRTYTEDLGEHEHLHVELGRLVTEDAIAAADHQVRCVPFATAEEWCFHKHVEYANDLMRAMGTSKTTIDLCPSCPHLREAHTNGGMCVGTGLGCSCVRFPDSPPDDGASLHEAQRLLDSFEADTV